MLATTKIRAIATASVIAALSVTGVASAAAVRHPGTHPKPITVLHKPVAAISAFPTGGKGSGTEATCALWSAQLNGDQGAVDAAVQNNDLAQYQAESDALNEDKNNALDAGCAVID
jgi:hypothetical protein